ncbi:MAG: hypothetical protein IT394_01720, partial [Candidatus Omnitrophica bacterium]|nr:hypothetical protein [Candidatus Omnitrophota bacterium]
MSIDSHHPPEPGPPSAETIPAISSEEKALVPVDGDMAPVDSPVETGLTSSWQPRLLVLLLVLGFALRLAYVSQITTPPFSDMADYETMALNLLEGKGLIMSDLYKAYRP